jgi:hypothetical protein
MTDSLWPDCDDIPADELLTDTLEREGWFDLADIATIQLDALAEPATVIVAESFL